jgi:hypothetical protein
MIRKGQPSQPRSPFVSHLTVTLVFAFVIAFFAAVYYSIRQEDIPHSGTLHAIDESWVLRRPGMAPAANTSFDAITRWLRERQFESAEKPRWAKTRIRRRDDTDRVAWFKGTWDGSQPFYIHVVLDQEVHESGRGGMLFLRGTVDWHGHDARSDQATQRFIDTMRQWWKNDHQRRLNTAMLHRARDAEARRAAGEDLWD